MTQQQTQPPATALESLNQSLADSIEPRYLESGPFQLEALHELYNENAKYFRNSMHGIGRNIFRFLNDPQAIKQSVCGHKNYDAFPAFGLPAGEVEEVEEFAALRTLRSRRSCRNFGAPLTLLQLGTVLKAALSSSARATPKNAPSTPLFLRPYASAGSLAPVEFYCGLLNTQDVPRMLGHYDPRSHRLRVIKKDPSLAAFKAFQAHEDGLLDSASAIVFITGVFHRSIAKYGLRGYKFTLMEAGAAYQTLQLAATSLGLGSLVWSSFFDDEVEAFLGIDGTSESIITCVLLGSPGANGVSDEHRLDGR